MSGLYTIKDKKSNKWSSVCCRTGIKSILVTIISNLQTQLLNVWVNFESFHYAINMDAVSSFVVFIDFDFMFLWVYC